MGAYDSLMGFHEHGNKPTESIQANSGVNNKTLPYTGNHPACGNTPVCFTGQGQFCFSNKAYKLQRLYHGKSYPEEFDFSPAKSFIGQPINIKIPIPVGKNKTKFIF